MKIVYFDYEIKGHHLEYINSIIKYIVKRGNSSNEYCFIVGNGASTILPLLASEELNNFGIKIIFLKDEEVALINSKKSNLSRSFANFKIANTYAKKINADKVYFLTLDLVHVPLIFFRTGYAIGGILFAPFTRLVKSSGLKNKLQLFRKGIQMRLMLRNAMIKDIYILNDEDECRRLNSVFRLGNVFKWLPDPVFGVESKKDFVIRDHHGIPANKKIILHFGALGERKGTLEIIESLQYLSGRACEDFALLIVGFASKDFDEEIARKISEIKSKSPSIGVFYKNEYISDDSIKKCYFDQSDVIAMPYKNPEYSSAVMGHAISAGKPIIAVFDGLVGKIIKDGGFGYLINSCEPQLIAGAIEEHLSNPIVINKGLADDFHTAHLPDNFARILLRN